MKKCSNAKEMGCSTDIHISTSRKNTLFSVEAMCSQQEKKEVKKRCIFFSFKYYTSDSVMDNIKIFLCFQNSQMLVVRDINGHCSLSLSDRKYQYVIMCF